MGGTNSGKFYDADFDSEKMHFKENRKLIKPNAQMRVTYMNEHNIKL